MQPEPSQKQASRLCTKENRVKDFDYEQTEEGRASAHPGRAEARPSDSLQLNFPKAVSHSAQ
jgi:hypothetical protein